MSEKLKNFLYLLGPTIIGLTFLLGIIYIGISAKPMPYSTIPSITFDNANMSFNYKSKDLKEASLNDPAVAIVSISNNSEVLGAFYEKRTDYAPGKYGGVEKYEINPIMVISKLQKTGDPKEISEKYKAQFEDKDFLILSEKNRTINGSIAYQVNYRGFFPGSYGKNKIVTKYMTIITFENKGNLYQIVYWSSYPPEKNCFNNNDFNYILDTFKIK